MAALTDDLPSCGDPSFTCSCTDCPVAPGCAVPPPSPRRDRQCRAGRVLCSDLVLILSYAALLALFAWLLTLKQKQREWSFALAPCVAA